MSLEEVAAELRGVAGKAHEARAALARAQELAAQAVGLIAPNR